MDDIMPDQLDPEKLSGKFLNRVHSCVHVEVAGTRGAGCPATNEE